MTANLVAVTACPTGIAHSQMGAESLERAAADAGHDIRVEVQGAMGVEDELTPADLAWAHAAIVAADVRVDTDRFRAADLPVLEVPVSDAVTSPGDVVSRAAALAANDRPTAADEPRNPAAPADSADDARDRGLLDRLRRLL